MKFGSKIVFVAGPYRGNGSVEAKRKNIAVARKNLCRLIEAEVPYYSPHLNLSQETIEFGGKTETYAIGTHNLFLERCDVLAVLPGWQDSSGTRDEVENANKRGMPVVFLEEDDAIESLKSLLAK